MVSRHVGRRYTNQFVDGTLSADKAMQVRTHLRGCQRCREAVDFIANLREAAGELYHPEAPARILDNVLTAREAGHRAILPQSPVRRPQRRLRPALAASLLLGVLAAAALLVTSSKADAGSSQLIMDLDGELLGLEYKPGAVLAGAGTVKIRGRYRTADERPPTRGLDNHYILGREFEVITDDGFKADLRLPESSVYAVMVAEDSEGNVDSNGGRMWEYLETNEDGSPTLEALKQQFMVLLLQHPLQAREPLEKMIELYPWHPEGHSLMLSYELQSSGDRDELVAAHKPTFIGLSAAMDAFPEDSYVAALLRYSRMLGERSAAAHLAGVLEHQAPDNPMATLARVRGTSGLEAYEDEWNRTADPVIASAAWRLAQAAGDEQTVRLWTDRYSVSDPARTPIAAATLVQSRFGADFAFDMAQREIDRIRTGYYDEFRPLQLSDTEFERVKQRSLLGLQGSLGEALLSEGMAEEATMYTAAIEAGEARLASLLPDPKPLLSANVVAEDGTEVDLHSLLDGVSVVFVWSRGADARVPNEILLSELSEAGIRVLGIMMAGDPVPDFGFDSYSDPAGEAGIAFGRWGARSIYVTGPGPRILLRTADLTDAVNVALSVR